MMFKDGIEYLDGVNWDFVQKHQSEQLATAKEVALLCEENGLEYYLDGGSMLGAMRHQGFIPWDDDIDFAMPRPDFERLKKIVRNSSTLKLLNWLEEPDCAMPMMKVLRYVPGDELNHHPGAIDLFVIDGVPRCKLVRKFQLKLFILVLNILAYRERSRVVSHRWLCAIISHLLPLSNRTLIRLFEKLGHNKSDWRPDSLVGVRFEPSAEKYFVPYRIYKDGAVRKVRFEDTEFRVPAHVEEFLTQFFGDWKKLPPVEERIPKHETDMDWFYSLRK